MRRSVLSYTASLALACAAAATPLMAQSNSGAGTDPWTVSWTGTLATGSGTAATVTSPPGAWVNTSPNSFWISTNSTASLPGGSGDNVQRESYDYTQVFNSASASNLQMTVWTDNFFHGFTLNGTDYPTSPLAPSPGDFAQPQARVFNLNLANGANTLVLHTTGDGQTDAVNVSFTSTPEPSSIALLGTGLFGLVPMVRRKRKV
jgi:hypothetical protein